jgi:hypothetical protein
MSQPKIYRYIPLELIYNFNLEDSPIGIDYKRSLTRRLYPKATMVKGELQKMEYYADYDLDNDLYTDKVIEVSIEYTRDLAGYALHRTTTRKWILEGSEINYAQPVKITKKYYIGKERDEEGVRRRRNITSWLKFIIGNHLITQAYLEAAPSAPSEAEINTKLLIGKIYYSSLSTEIVEFEELSLPNLRDSIVNNLTDLWLDDNLFGVSPITTVRDYLVEELNI